MSLEELPVEDNWHSPDFQNFYWGPFTFVHSDHYSITSKERKARYETLAGWKRRAIKYRNLYKIQFSRVKAISRKYNNAVHHHKELWIFLSERYPEIQKEFVKDYQLHKGQGSKQYRKNYL
jgi:hypothetical protein